MGSSKLADARPVRRPPSSCFNSWIAPCIRRLSSLRSWAGAGMAILKTAAPGPNAVLVLAKYSVSSCNEGEAPAALQHRGDRLLLSDREDDDRQTVLSSKREGGRVHDLETTVDRLLMCKSGIPLSVCIALWICAVHAIHIGRL